jgi:hypothetical protein
MSILTNSMDALDVEVVAEVEDSILCLICFESCPGEGEHRLSALSCGHGPFGSSCMSELLAASNELKCPCCRSTHTKDGKPIIAVPLFFRIKPLRSRLSAKLGDVAKEKECLQRKLQLESSVVLHLKKKIDALKSRVKLLDQVRKEAILLRSSRDFWREKATSQLDVKDEYRRLWLDHGRLQRRLRETSSATVGNGRVGGRLAGRVQRIHGGPTSSAVRVGYGVRPRIAIRLRRVGNGWRCLH